MKEATSTAAAPRWPLAVAVGAVVIMSLALAAQGRVWWCAQGDWLPYSFDVWSPHNSQHLVDPYLFTHVLHGVVFYAVARLLLGAGRFRHRLMAAVVVESLWELVENSQFIIDKYRESTVSLDYNGDSIANSVADIAAMVGGFLLAGTLPVWGSVVFFFVVEAILIWWIRDSLLLNVIMLTVPIEAIKQWQMKGMP